MSSTKVLVRRDGRTVEVELSEDLGRATVEGKDYPVRVLEELGTRVELEIAGARVVVDGWPSACAAPPGPVSVNGESWAVELERKGPLVTGRPVAQGPSVSSKAAAAPPSSGPPGTTVIVPPMPGRVVEVRVQEGETVEKGAVLLVLEAMKMRNEIVAPSRGVVRGLAVRDGSNVRAREAMLRLEPA